jgi:hypothetical protein
LSCGAGSTLVFVGDSQKKAKMKACSDMSETSSASPLLISAAVRIDGEARDIVVDSFRHETGNLYRLVQSENSASYSSCFRLKGAYVEFRQYS